MAMSIRFHVRRCDRKGGEREDNIQQTLARSRIEPLTIAKDSAFMYMGHDLCQGCYRTPQAGHFVDDGATNVAITGEFSELGHPDYNEICLYSWARGK